MANKFYDEKIHKLDQKWSAFRNALVEDDPDADVETYEKLMVKTFPIIYKAWTDNNRMIDKDIAKLTTTLQQLFWGTFDEEWNFLRDPDLEIAWEFHFALMDGILWECPLEVDEKGIIVIENDTHRWVVDSKTFELPEEEPWIEDEDEDEDEDENEDDD